MPGNADQILEAMARYTGHWRSDRKTGRRGETFHFEYDLDWLDEGRTIARLLITRVDADGAVGTVFEGYKGRKPDGSGVYYFAVSPAGRGARGEVVLEGEELVTRYRGWTAEGNAVEIRDVFEPVRDGRFRSTTFLRASPDEEWRQIADDEWTRVRPDP